jgi:hypothetical protein
LIISENNSGKRKNIIKVTIPFFDNEEKLFYSITENLIENNKFVMINNFFILDENFEKIQFKKNSLNNEENYIDVEFKEKK